MNDELLASLERRVARPLPEALARTAYLSDNQLHDAWVALTDQLETLQRSATADVRVRATELLARITDQYWSIVILRSENPEIHTVALDRAVTMRIRPDANVIVSFDHV